MRTLCSFFRREPVLVIAALAAAASCFFVPPDRQYLDYFDLRTLSLLYCLMVVVAGLRKAGLFERMADTLCSRAKSLRVLGLLLTALPFFSSMLITNDVALLTFVPFAAVVLSVAGRRDALLRIAVLQTVAANLGSMLTPVGNPQNLYLYSRYALSPAAFFSATLPFWAFSLLLLTLLCLFVLPREGLTVSLAHTAPVDARGLLLHLALFALCLLTVLRVLPWPVMLALVVLLLLIFDRRLLLSADFWLLLTFAAFFVFSGNLARMEAVDRLLRRLLAGREYWTALAASQVISNVPAALLLSGFTDNARAILLGVDVGGLGTPIASLASLIGLKLYARTENASSGKFLFFFTIVNFALLALLSALWLVL